MRARPGLLTAVLFLASGLAAASEAVVPWSQLDLRPARTEAPALGPDRLAAGPTGQVAIWNPASGWLDLYDGLGAFKDGEARASSRSRARRSTPRTPLGTATGWRSSAPPASRLGPAPG